MALAIVSGLGSSSLFDVVYLTLCLGELVVLLESLLVTLETPALHGRSEGANVAVLCFSAFSSLKAVLWLGLMLHSYSEVGWAVDWTGEFYEAFTGNFVVCAEPCSVGDKVQYAFEG